MNKMLRRSGQPLIPLRKKMWKTYGKAVNIVRIIPAFTVDKLWINKKEIILMTSFWINFRFIHRLFNNHFLNRNSCI